MYEFLASNLAFLRKSRTPPYTQRELAMKLSISRVSYWRYENGSRTPPLWFLENVAEFYDIPLSTLLSEDMERGENNE